MPEEAAGDRTEEATPRRREKEREAGRVARSRDLAASLVLLGAMLFLRYGGDLMGYEMLAVAEQTLTQYLPSLPPPEGNEILPHILTWLYWCGRIAGPFLVTIMLIAIIANLIQTGPVFSWEPLEPNFDRLNPISGLMRMFSLRSLMTLAVNFLKIALVVAVAYQSLAIEMPRAYLMVSEMPAQIMIHGGLAVSHFGLKLAAVLVILGLLDFGYQRYQYERDIMMTKQQVQEELKEVEGDPQVRARRRAIQRQLARQRMMQEVPKAEVVVRNPTHYAVAISYKPNMEAPRVVAKGEGLIAQRIIEIAKQHGVPLWYAPALARKLYREVEIDQYIPPELFPALAEILAHVLKGEKRAQYERLAAASR
ncbi:MAG: flagellar biosynthesis protein FlhB [Planctomycetota bacterium]|nr:flagellar biosynthesis protein FlhB [Planctomycetota bacterium]